MGGGSFSRRMKFLGLVLLGSAAASCGYPDLQATCEPFGCVDPDAVSAYCTISSNCVSADTPVCDTARHECVQCTIDDKHACTGNTPICDTVAETCQGCATDDDCQDGAATGVCLPSGACVVQARILHVTINGSGSDCSAAAPCKLDAALGKVSETTNVVKLDEGGNYNSNGYTLVNDVTIDARTSPVAVFGRNTSGPVFGVDSSKNVTLLGGDIAGATGSGGDGIRCNDQGATGSLTLIGTTIESNNESAIDASYCNIVLAKSVIRNNSPNSANNAAIRANDGSIAISDAIVSGNRGGGLSTTSATKVIIVGNLFINNGDAGSNTAGVSINTSSVGMRIEFNTITQNRSQNAAIAGFNCSATAGFTARNNIISQNTGVAQVSTGCSYEYSIIQQAGVTGTGVITSDPMFVSSTDAHLQAGSPARNAANPTSDLTGLAAKDIDGKPRVAGGAANAADIGAYVYVAP